MDEKGCYTELAGEKFSGRDVLEDGNRLGGYFISCYRDYNLKYCHVVLISTHEYASVLLHYITAALRN